MSDAENKNSPNPENRSDMLHTGVFFAARFRIIKSLGQGAMGKVYLASDLMLGEGKVALKLLSSDLEKDPVHLSRFLKEVQLTREVTHPAVVRTYDIGQFESCHYFTMEYVEGQNLSEMLRATPCSTEKCIDILMQLCEGLCAIHDKGIVHRDLKSSNVLITKDGKVKIADFGIARTDVPNLKVEDELVGSATHLAPEIWKQSGISQLSDLYSLGVILYELITGKLPFDGKTAYSLMWSHLKSLPINPNKINPDAPVWLVELCQKLLSKEPINRPGSAKKVLEIIRAQLVKTTEKPAVANQLPATKKSNEIRPNLSTSKTDIWAPAQYENDDLPGRKKRKHSGLKLKAIIDSIKRDQTQIKESINLSEYSPIADPTVLINESIPVLKRIVFSIISSFALVVMLFVLNNYILDINNVSVQTSSIFKYVFNKFWISLSLSAILLIPFYLICSIMNGLGYGLSCLLKLCIITSTIFLLSFAGKLFYMSYATPASTAEFQVHQAKSAVDTAIVNLSELLSLRLTPTAFDAALSQDNLRNEYIVPEAPSFFHQSIHLIFILILLIVACAIVCNFDDRRASFFKTYFFIIPILIMLIGNLILKPGDSGYPSGWNLILGNTNVMLATESFIIGIITWGSMLLCALATLGWRIKIKSTLLGLPTESYESPS